MLWQELADSIRPSKTPPRVILVLCGRGAANLTGLPGPGLSETEVITFHRARYASNEDDLAGTLDVVRLNVPDETLLRHVIVDEGQFVSIIALDWLNDTSTWPATLAEAMQAVPKDSKIIFTAINFDQAAKRWRSSAALSERVDACHQFLRVNALKHKASLVYTTGGDHENSIDWLGVVSRIMEVRFTSRPGPEEQLVADPIFATYGGASSDTQEKIMALNSSFDYDAALRGDLRLDSLVDQEPVTTNSKELSLDSILAEFDEKTQSSRMSEDTAVESHKLVYDGIGTGVSEDRRVISEFFTKIAQRST